ncbi:acyltransferase family protein [Flavobacterium ajazii]|uniref:acyltransferase family protein n=1 Tax=Flavobacterium ajazii TaxID=2692318 RepID=UPI0013CFD075|nr:acyltransferase [Flavobacterium ajazii]
MEKRIKNLDLFRFLAILLVVYLHIGTRFLSNIIKYDVLLKVGKYGVEMFFLLSGFLISNIYFKKKNVSLLKFWLGRFLRTYPPYIITLIISYAAVYFFKKQSFDWGYILFFQNFYQTIPFFLASWSLCVEEHFYLVFPFIVLFLSLLKNKYLQLFVWITLVLAPSFIRLYFGNYLNMNWGYYTTASIFRFDGIALGCLISFLINHYNFSFKVNPYFSLFMFMVFLLFGSYLSNFQTVFTYSFGYLILVIIIGLTFLSFYFADEFFISRFNFIKEGAYMAYSIYLTHNLVINFIEMIVQKNNISNEGIISLLTLFVCIVIGKIFYILVEKKAIEKRNLLLKNI